MKIAIEKSAFNGTKYSQNNSQLKHGQKHSQGLIINNKDEFIHKADDLREELNVYSKYKNNPLNMPKNNKVKLKELLDLLKESQKQNIYLSTDAAKQRDILIDKIEDMFKHEELQENLNVSETVIENTREVAQQNKRQMEMLAEQMEILKSCLEIVSKILKGTASIAEKRFLMKTSPEMYSMAIAGIKHSADNNDNKTTVKIDFEDKTTSGEEQLQNIMPASKINAEIINNSLKNTN